MPCATPSISGKNRRHYLDKPAHETQQKWNDVWFKGPEKGKGSYEAHGGR